MKFARLVPSDAQLSHGRPTSNYKNRRASQLRLNNSTLRVGLLAGTGAVQPNEWTHGRARYESEGKKIIIGASPRLHRNVLIPKQIVSGAKIDCRQGEENRDKNRWTSQRRCVDRERFNDRDSPREEECRVTRGWLCRLTNQRRETNSRITGQFGIRGCNRHS